MKNLLWVFAVIMTNLACRWGSGTPSTLKTVAIQPDLELTDIELDQFIAGSCYRTKLASGKPIWETISKLDPKMFLWLGDSIYADTHESSVKKALWGKIESDPFYKKLPFVWGVYDDHDFGDNNQQGGKWEHSKQAQSDYLDFLKVSEDSSLRKREGHYGLIRLKQKNGGVVDFVYLDTRYFKESKGILGGKMLGHKQWSWFEDYVRSSNADLVFVLSGTQVLATKQLKESWDKMTDEHARLLSNLEKIKGKVVVLSGDRHFGEVSKNGSVNEVTTSGMTHFKTAKEALWLNNPYAVAPRLHALNAAEFKIYWRGPKEALIPYVSMRFFDPTTGKKLDSPYVF